MYSLQEAQLLGKEWAVGYNVTYAVLAMNIGTWSIKIFELAISISVSLLLMILSVAWADMN